MKIPKDFKYDPRTPAWLIPELEKLTDAAIQELLQELDRQDKKQE